MRELELNGKIRPATAQKKKKNLQLSDGKEGKSKRRLWSAELISFTLVSLLNLLRCKYRFVEKQSFLHPIQ